MLDARRQILSAIAAASDLDERLAAVPADARLRGLFFESVDRVVAAAGHADALRALSPERRTPTRLYPVADYLVHAAIGAALLSGPEHLDEGLLRIGRRNVIAVTESQLGRTLLRVLDPDPRRLLEQGALGKRLTCTYGRWSVSFPRARCAIVTMRDEYIWIDSLLRGAARGTFEAIGIEVHDEVELRDRFSGRHVLTW